MFVTLARRNRSLIDRQLALIDELESDEEDPEALADFYRLDHMATRMRRNSESLLVLAGSEPPRTWRTPLEIDDVVRAAIGEIEDYRRVDVLTLETVRLKGAVVADLSHLLSELLENASQFSPPTTRVRVSGHFHEEGYLLTVSDRGVGIPQARLGELNRLLERPPVIGLALEPTLGLYVVAMLAKRHGIGVRLVAGAPGVSAKLLIPPVLYDQTPIALDEPAEGRHASISEPPSQPANGHSIPGRVASRQSASSPPQPAPAPQAVPTPRWAPPSNVAPAALPSSNEPVVRAVPAASAPAPSAPGSSVPGSSGPAPSSPASSTPIPSVPTRATAPGGSGVGAPIPASGDISGGLPVRRPGSSYEADPASERPVAKVDRAPDAVRSSLGAFQSGMEAGRRERKEGDDE
jgi:hypothetical protein